MKSSRLQLLTSKFENLKMGEDESIQDFHMNIMDIANSSSDLGEMIPEAKLVQKILRSLPKKFDMKVTAIEEAHDINTMKVGELMGSLQTYELAISEKTEKKKSIALVSDLRENDPNSNKDLSKAVGILEKQCSQLMKKMEEKSRSDVKTQSFNFNRRKDLGRFFNDKRGKGIQCYGCDGFGHTKLECPPSQKKEKKGMSAS